MHRRARFAWRGDPGCTGQRPTIRSRTLTSPTRISVHSSRPTRAPRWEPAVVPPPPPRKQPTPTPVEGLLDGFCPEPHPDEQLAVNAHGQMFFVSLPEIESLEAVGRCVKLHVGKHVHRLRDTFAAVAAKLPPGRFVQISRLALVNAAHVQGLQRLFFDEYEVVLRSGRRLPVARGYGLGLLRSRTVPATAGGDY